MNYQPCLNLVNHLTKCWNQYFTYRWPLLCRVLFICMFVCRLYISACLSISLFICICLPIFLSVCLSRSTWTSVCLSHSACLFFICFSVCVLLYFLSLPVYLFVYMPLFWAWTSCLYIYIYISMCSICYVFSHCMGVFNAILSSVLVFYSCHMARDVQFILRTHCFAISADRVLSMM